MKPKKMPKTRNGLVPIQFFVTPDNWEAIMLGLEIEGTTKDSNYILTDFIHDTMREKLAHLGVEFGEAPPRGRSASIRRKKMG